MFGLGSDDSARFLYLSLLLAFVLGGLGYRRGPWRAGFQHLAVWAVFGLALVALYAYRAPLQRFAAPVLGELMPNRAVIATNADGDREFAIRRGLDGHFSVDADVNGATVNFLVDTGASSTVLNVADAERGGIDTSVLAFDRAVQTANGIALSARATIQSLRIGPYEIADLPVGIMPGEALGSSLLGMNTIDRFSAWRISGDEMVLVP